MNMTVQPKENTPPNGNRRLSRSPHPYQRVRVSLSQDNGTYSPHFPTTSLLPATSSQPINTESGPTYFDADHRKRRKRSSSPSDSGTEADDERTTFLGLPAPPVRPRKGLKGANHSGTASPLLTPSYLDEEPRKLALKSRHKRTTSWQSYNCTNEETTQVWNKFARRRRAELIRRASEILLLGAVGFIACMSDTARLFYFCAGGSFSKAFVVQGIRLDHVPAALWGHIAVILGLYALYPLRIVLNNWVRSVRKGRSAFYIHIPAAFEPAPLFYPVFVPVFVAVSLMHVDADVLLPNLILSIASIPSKVIPFNSDIAWYNSIHWVLSAVPILASQRWRSKDSQFWVREGYHKAWTSDANSLLLLYPLHQALLPALRYLTTTSLLPAELQLLSIAMINLLLLSQSPQTVILQCLLWVGGLAIFVMCGKVLVWEVALARIPSWRFRRPIARALEGNTLLLAIDDTLGGRLGEWGWTSVESGDSDDSQNNNTKRPLEFSGRMRHGQTNGINTRSAQKIADKSLAQIPAKAPISTTDDIKQTASVAANGAWQEVQLGASDQRQRRYTLPSYIGSYPVDPSKGDVKRPKTTNLQPSRTWSLRSLSKAQAVVLKWLFALYVYAIVIAIIAFAVRPQVSRDALHGQEPLGWALGYLLGNVPLFRHLTTKLKLDHWVPLPKSMPSSTSSETQSWLELLHGPGVANLRLLICVYCLAIICAGLAIVFRLSSVAEVDTRRKVFHGMMVAMFLPTIFVDPPFVSLAFVLILAIFLLLDLFRATQLPPLSKPLTYFLAPYVDGRDHRGPVIVSHIFLLIGCAIPLWLSLAAVKRTGEGPWEGWGVERREMSMISGVVCVGMGDAAASLIGRRYGRRRWCWSGGKSLEGSLAFALAVVLGLSLARLMLLTGGWQGDSGDSWAVTLGKASIAATGASLTEAVLTGGNDNVIVPVMLWLLVRGLRI